MKLLGISGKKQSGKNTSVNFLFGLEMVAGEWNYKGQSVNIEYFSINKAGKLVVPANLGDKVKHTVWELENPSVPTQEFMALNIWQYLKCYSFADKLKQNLCMDIFGLTYEQCYGTNAQKDTFTKYKWVDMFELTGRDISYDNEYMTARQFMQWIGTDVMRKLYGQVWVESCLRQIQQEQPDLAIIPDVRFPNEVKGIQDAGGKVIRFTRMKTDVDAHSSETALDGYEGFDFILDNMEMTIPQQNAAFAQILKDWSYFPWPISEHVISISNMYKEEVAV